MTRIPLRLDSRFSRFTTVLSAGLGSLSVVCVATYPLPVAGLGLAGLGGLGLARWYVRGAPLPNSPFTVPLGLYGAGSLVGFYISLSPLAAQGRLLGLLAALGTFFLILDLAPSPNAAARLVRVGLPVVALATAFLLVLVARRDPGLQHLFPEGSAWARVVFGMSAAASEGLAAVPYLGQRYRFTSSGLAALAAYGFGLALGPLLTGSCRRTRFWGATAASYFGLLLLLIANRTALLSALPVALLFLALHRRWVWAGVITLTTVALLAGVGVGLHSVSPFPARFLSAESFHERLEIWGNVLFLLRDFPLTGIGLGVPSVKAVYDTYFLPLGTRPFHAHNFLLQTYLESGLLGLAGLLGLVVTGGIVAWQTLARVRAPEPRSAAVSAGAAALTLVLVGLTEIVPTTTVGLALFFGALALLVVTGAPPAPASGRPRPTLLGAGVAGALLVTLVLSTVARGGSPGFASAARFGRFPQGVATAAYLNLGTLRLVWATRDSRISPRERREHLAAATRYLTEALESAPGNPDIYRNLATAALASSQPVLAEGLLMTAQTLAAPDDSHAFFQFGRLYREAGSVDGAIAAWRRVDRKIGARTGTGPDAQLILWGANLVVHERWAAATAVSRAAVHAAPANPEPYRALAIATSQHQGEEAALHAMLDLAARYPGIPWASEEVARLYRLLKRPHDAAAWAHRAKAVLGSTEWKTLARQAQEDGTLLVRNLLRAPTQPPAAHTEPGASPR